jgi:hypothetical protein
MTPLKPCRLCGSLWCGVFCRFYRNEAERDQAEADFMRDWEEAQRRLDAGEKEVTV